MVVLPFHKNVILLFLLQVNGVVVIMDFDGLGMSQVMALSPSFSARLLNFIQVRSMYNFFLPKNLVGTYIRNGNKVHNTNTAEILLCRFPLFPDFSLCLPILNAVIETLSNNY